MELAISEVKTFINIPKCQNGEQNSTFQLKIQVSTSSLNLDDIRYHQCITSRSDMEESYPSESSTGNRVHGPLCGPMNLPNEMEDSCLVRLKPSPEQGRSLIHSYIHVTTDRLSFVPT